MKYMMNLKKTNVGPISAKDSDSKRHILGHAFSFWAILACWAVEKISETTEILRLSMLLFEVFF